MISAKHGEPDAKKPNPGSRWTLTVDEVVKSRKTSHSREGGNDIKKRNWTFYEAITVVRKKKAKSLQPPFILIRISY